MKDIEIKINRETRMVDLSKTIIGNDAENLQGNLIFSFNDEFVEGQARLEYEIKNQKNFISLERIEEKYVIPIKSVITKEGTINMQLVITEGINEENIAIFKSNIFYVYCNCSINAEIEQLDEYPTWIEIANTKLNQVDNVDIDITTTDVGTMVEITRKDGTKKSAIVSGEGGGNEEEKDPTVPTHVKNIKETDISSWNNKSNFSGSYNDLTNKPTIPTNTSQLTNDSNYVKNNDVATQTKLGLVKMWTSINEDGDVGLNISTEV